MFSWVGGKLGDSLNSSVGVDKGISSLCGFGLLADDKYRFLNTFTTAVKQK